MWSIIRKMNKLLYTLSTLSILLFSCSSNTEKVEEGTSNEPVIAPKAIEFETTDEGNVSTDYPEIQFETESLDIGSMVDGEVKRFKFYFTNTGKSDLIIKSATGSCGCTVPSKPEGPIAPGERSSIDVEFNSAGRGPGPEATEGLENQKNITVWTNCKEAQKVINFRAVVLPK